MEQLNEVIKERERQINIKISRPMTAPVIESTSVAPRQRPKGSQSSGALGGRGLPLPLQNAAGIGSKSIIEILNPDINFF